MARKSKGYVYIYRPRHPVAHKSGYAAEHRMVWYDLRGSLPEGHEVHHKNGVRDDNRIENLACMLKADHDALHRPKVWVWLTCATCDGSFRRLRWKANRTLDRGARIVCSRVCSGKLRHSPNPKRKDRHSRKKT